MARMLPNGFGEPRPAGGRFTAEENNILRKAIDDYCAEQHVTPAILGTSKCKKGGEHVGAWTIISQALPERTRESVYRRGLRLIHPYDTGPWSEKEEHSLVQLVEQHGSQWAVIQNHVNRNAESCRDQYRLIQAKLLSEKDDSGGKIKTGRWDADEVETFRNIIRESLGIKDPNASFAEIASKVEKDGTLLCFQTIGKQMDRTRLSCNEKWLQLTRKLRRKGTGKVVLDGRIDAAAADVSAKRLSRTESETGTTEEKQSRRKITKLSRDQEEALEEPPEGFTFPQKVLKKFKDSTTEKEKWEIYLDYKKKNREAVARSNTKKKEAKEAGGDKSADATEGGGSSATGKKRKKSDEDLGDENAVDDDKEGATNPENAAAATGKTGQEKSRKRKREEDKEAGLDSGSEGSPPSSVALGRSTTDVRGEKKKHLESKKKSKKQKREQGKESKIERKKARKKERKKARRKEEKGEVTTKTTVGSDDGDKRKHKKEKKTKKKKRTKIDVREE